MVEWFNNLSDGNKIAIVIPVGIAGIGGIIGLFKWLFSISQKQIHQEGSHQTAGNIKGNNNIVAGGSVHTGTPPETLNIALQAVIKALEIVGTEQSKNLVSEVKNVSGEKLSNSIDPIQDKCNNRQNLPLEKEFQLYGELWKALIDVRSSIIITPTLDRIPNGKSLYDVYKDRYEIAVDAFNKAKNLFEENRPFFPDDVSNITRGILSKTRKYIHDVGRMLRTGNFDDELHDKADDLLEIIPKAIDEIEKAIKVRIGLSPKAEDNIGDIDLEQILTSRHYRLIFNPTANRSKAISFISGGVIQDGRDNNENTWRLIETTLELLAIDGSVYSSFRYNRTRDCFENTNDPNTQSIRDQIIVPQYVTHR